MSSPKVKYLIRKRALGDVLWIEPVIRALSKKGNRLVVHTKYNVLFQNYPIPNVLFKDKLSIGEKILVRLEQLFKRNVFTISLDNAYENVPGTHFLHAYQKKSGLPLTSEYPQIYLSDAEKAKTFLEGKYVVLHIESFAEKSRQIYGIDWNAVATHLNHQGFTVVQTGLNPEPIENTIHIRTSIRDLMSLMYKASLFIGIDSGPSHIAASLKVPSIILFGAINPLLRHFPEKLNGIVMKKSCKEICKLHNVQDSSEHKCLAVDKDGLPSCGFFTTEELEDHINRLINKDDR